MPPSAIEKIADIVSTICISHAAPRAIPPDLLQGHRIPGWFVLSLGTVYVSFAIYWVIRLPIASDAYTSLGRKIEDKFIHFAKQTDFDANVRDVIVFPAEQDAICHSWEILPSALPKAVSTSSNLLKIVFPSRIQQYLDDLYRGGLLSIEQPQSEIGPTFFVYKRFLQHMYAFRTDPNSTTLDDPPHPNWFILHAIFGNTFWALMKTVHEAAQSEGVEL